MTRQTMKALSSLVIALICAGCAYAGTTGACEALGGISLPHTHGVTAESITSGTFAPKYSNAIGGLPQFCRVAGVIAPSPDSYIRFEVWLPEKNWNHRFLGVGNAGFGGSIEYGTLARNLKHGYATAATDTGHEADSSDASWAFHHPNKVVDFAYRGLHETVIDAKLLVHRFYDEPSFHSYFDGCSNGGRQGLLEAQKFPEDFDGIVSGAPMGHMTHILAAGLQIQQKLYSDPASYISIVKLPALAASVLAACDAQDGLTDGIISSPFSCAYDPAPLLCQDHETGACLTPAQAATVKQIYNTPLSATGGLNFPGLLPGSESEPGGWAQWILGSAPGRSSGDSFVLNFFRYMVLSEPKWNPLTANVGAVARIADERIGPIVNAIGGDIRPFYSRGGKLIIYHGLSDSAVSPLYSIDYYRQVRRLLGPSAADACLRLYLIPGMQHCGGGVGPSITGSPEAAAAWGIDYGLYSALENWVENGTPPGTVSSTKILRDGPRMNVSWTRPLCNYPGAATYTDSPDGRSSLVCTSSEK